jgi:aldehyde dehydrogenase (NAD+)
LAVAEEPEPPAEPEPPDAAAGLPGIDRTPKMYVGGRQARPDGGYSMTVAGADGQAIGEVGRGNRKDIRNAVEGPRSARIRAR